MTTDESKQFQPQVVLKCRLAHWLTLWVRTPARGLAMGLARQFKCTVSSCTRRKWFKMTGCQKRTLFDCTGQHLTGVITTLPAEVELEETSGPRQKLRLTFLSWACLCSPLNFPAVLARSHPILHCMAHTAKRREVLERLLASWPYGWGGGLKVERVVLPYTSLPPSEVSPG